MSEIRLSLMIGPSRMAQKIRAKKRNTSPDWLVHGLLTKIGDTFDRLTGRGWKPSSSLATSELAERLRALVDAEAIEESRKWFYVPHNIKLKVQWDKFATDSDDSLKKLETELLAALIDHINDRRYHTYAPISLEVKADYFTNGVKLFASFEDKGEDEREVSLDVTVPILSVNEILPEIGPPAGQLSCLVTLRFETTGKKFERTVTMEPGQRLSLGRTAENDIPIDDNSISKVHATLLLNNEGGLVLADTGSTNGTFIDGERIAYGKAFDVQPGQIVKLGTVNILIDRSESEYEPSVGPETASREADGDEIVRIGEFEFSRRKSPGEGDGSEPSPTVPSIGFTDSVILRPISTETAVREPESKTIESIEEQTSDK